MLPQARFQTGLLIYKFAQLVFRQLEERAEARGGDDFGAPDESFPKRRVSPDFLGDKTRKEGRGNEANQGFVCRDSLDDLFHFVSPKDAGKAEEPYRSQEQNRENGFIHNLLHDHCQDFRPKHVGHTKADSNGCRTILAQFNQSIDRGLLTFNGTLQSYLLLRVM
jgi:hypothetical protein